MKLTFLKILVRLKSSSRTDSDFQAPEGKIGLNVFLKLYM